MYSNSNRYSHSQHKHANSPDYKSGPIVYDDHERLNFELAEKVNGLRSLSIKIGDELRSQNNLLGDMSGQFDHSEGVLRSTMSRLSRMAKENFSSGGLYCYLLIFVCIIFFMCWFILRFY